MKGRALAAEVMVMNQAIRHLIREDKLHQIYGQVQLGQGASGMMTMNQSLVSYTRRGRSHWMKRDQTHPMSMSLLQCLSLINRVLKRATALKKRLKSPVSLRAGTESIDRLRHRKEA